MKLNLTSLIIALLLCILVLTGINLYLHSRLTAFGLYPNVNSAAKAQKEIPRLSIMPAGSGPMLGNANAPVTIIAFVDYECPFCKQFLNNTLPQIEEEYINSGKVKVVFRDLPLETHSNAKKLAQFAHYYHRKSGFSEFLRLVLDKDFDSGAFVNERDSLLSDLSRDVMLNDEISESKLMANIAGITATPSFVVNSRILVGSRSFSEFSQLIDYALESPQAIKRDKPVSGTCN